MTVKDILIKNRWRYLAFVVGFFLFVAPFAIFTRAVFYLTGNIAEATLHNVCFRMPIDWIFGGRLYSILGPSWLMSAFIIGLIIISIFLGPVFCGWLCPVGAVSETVSRVIRIPKRFRFRISDIKLTVSIRYGFLLGFIIVAALVGFGLAKGQLASICCRYCAAAVLQDFSSALFGEVSAIEYWHSGSLITLIFWLVIGGVFMSGGRGWCLFFCPLGALSGLAHKLGSKLGFYRVDYKSDGCSNCGKCHDVCPMWAIDDGKSVERTLCVNCMECVNLCKSYVFVRGKSHGSRLVYDQT